MQAIPGDILKLDPGTIAHVRNAGTRRIRMVVLDEDLAEAHEQAIDQAVLFGTEVGSSRFSESPVPSSGAKS